MSWFDQVELFVSFCIICAEFGSLALNDEQLIGLYQECLVWILLLGDVASEASVYLSLGRLHRKNNQITTAIQYYNDYLRASKGMKEAQTVVYMILGNIYLSLNDYHKAMEHFTSGLDIATEFDDTENERVAVHNLGAVYYKLGDFDMAMQYYKKSLEIAQQQCNNTWLMEAYENLGAVSLFALQKYHAAIEYCEKCLSIATEIDKRDFKQRAYRNLAIAYQDIHDYQESIRYSKNHLEIAIETGDKHGQHQDYFRLGNLCKALGKCHEAIGYFKEYLEISIEIGDMKAEVDAYGRLAIAYRSISKYNDAIEYHEKAINNARQVQNQGWEGIAVGSLANTYHSLGQYQQAIECAQKSLSIARETGNREVERNALGQLGNVYHKSEEFEKAIEYHEQSLEISKEIGDKNGEGKDYGNLGLGYTSLADYDKAIEYHKKNLDVFLETGDKGGQVNPYGHLGNAYRLIGQYGKSIDVTQKSLDLAKELDDKDGQGGASYLLAHCYYVQSYKQHDDGRRCALLRDCETHLKESIRCYEWMFDHLEDQDHFKVSIVDTFVFAYKLLTRVYIETQQNERALLTCDGGRARALSDVLTSKYNMEVDTSQQRQRRVMEYCDVESIMTTTTSCILYFGIIMKPHKTVENYAVEGCVATWIVSADKPLITTLNDDIEDIESSFQITADENVNKLVNQAFDEMKVRQGVDCEDRSLDTNPAVTRCIECVEYDDSPLETLFQLFLSPVQDHLTQDEIVIIPDGPLFTVPYAALRDPKTKKYLSETKRLRLAPSLATLKILKSADNHSTTGALIVGNPTVGKVMFHGKMKRYNDLPGAKREAELIGEMLGVTPITGQQATKQAIKQRLREGVALIHFAAHGSTEGEIALTPNPRVDCDDSIPQEDDYLLTMKDVQEIGITAQLVVLSCCHSGRGDIKSEGVVGMSRAFLAAGARAVVGSLWAIADNATMEFMEGFYTHLKQQESASVSLHKTMQDMRNKYSEPTFWAPFFLIGDDVTINL